MRDINSLRAEQPTHIDFSSKQDAFLLTASASMRKWIQVQSHESHTMNQIESTTKEIVPTIPAVTSTEEEILCLETEAGQNIAGFDAELIPSTHRKLFNSLVSGKGNQILVMPEDIRIIPGFNPRFDTAAYRQHVQNIADSIYSEGFYQDKPLAGYAGMDGKKPVVFLTEGQTRYRAALLAIERGAPLEYIPLVLKPEGTSLEDLTVALVRSNQGREFTPLELALICARLRKFDWDNKKIADKLGFKSEYVRQLLSLAAAPHSVRSLVEAGTVPAGVAIQALREHGAEAGEVLDQAYKQAKTEGREKITRRNLPSSMRKKALTKVAPRMFDALEAVAKHSSYQALPDDLRVLIESLLKDVTKAAEDNAEQNTSDPKDAKGGDESSTGEAPAGE